MCVAFNSPKSLQPWALDTVTCAGFANSVLAAQDLELAFGVLGKHLGNEGVDRDVAQAIHVERPLPTLFIAELAQLLDEPAKQRLPGLLGRGQCGALEEDLPAKAGFKVLAAR